MASFIRIHPADTVAVALAPLEGSVRLADGSTLVLPHPVPTGHKFAVASIAAGDLVVKYGCPIGRALVDIKPGDWVHTHNLATTLAGEKEYVRDASRVPPPQPIADAPLFMGYRRPDGKVGVRNEVWVIPTVGCVNWLAERLARLADAARPPGVDAVVAFPHPFGCSQMGDDHERTRRVLAGLARHPNAAAVLVVGLGCENNTLESFRALLLPEEADNPRYTFLQAQDEDDELAAGTLCLERLLRVAAGYRREAISVAELRVGLKCGGSDGLSGITANPLLGAFSDWLIDRGGGTVLTEVPEMFGAEESLLNRAVDDEVFRRGVEMVNAFKRYYADHGQPVYENPSPGNKEGGISTLEDKSLGCTQKGGTRAVVDVIGYGEAVRRPGLTLLSGPGNDLVAVGALAAAGVHLILFTTGRGTPLGSPVPVVKVSTNLTLAGRKKHWIDFDAGPAAETGVDGLLPGFIDKVLRIASGEAGRNEANGCRDFAIFKDGVTL